MRMMRAADEREDPEASHPMKITHTRDVTDVLDLHTFRPQDVKELVPSKHPRVVSYRAPRS